MPTLHSKPTPAPQVKPVHTPVSSSAPIDINQEKTTSWVFEGRTYYRYSASLTNRSTKTIKDIQLFINRLHGPLWGLTKSGNSYSFPAWINSLPAGKSLEFVYVHAATPADVSVSRYTLA